LTPDWSRIGLGISDDVEVASRLSTKFSYTNTFFDSFPHLDIRDIPTIAKNSFEFVSCSDVLEHVDVNLDKAIRGLSKLLKRGGFAVLSVPINQDAEKIEFYPNLKTFKITNGVVKWRNHKGRSFVDLNPEFHGGRGQNLAFRQFANESFREVVLRNGFESISNGFADPKFGVPWKDSAGVFIARV
jgi:ubiquinone/menaquinone biosynthesis C-methylase UbiE